MPNSIPLSIARAIALFFGVFSLLNILGELRTPGFDANEWWLDFRFVPPVVGQAFLLLASVAMIAHAIRPAIVNWRRATTAVAVAVLALVAVANVAQFYVLAVWGTFRPGIWVPLSMLILAWLIIVLWSAIRPAAQERARMSWFAFCMTLAASAVLFPLAQIYCFGKTDYRRPADVIVVLGAKVHADGQLSQALDDRVRTACGLYRDGLAPRLIFSGGPGEGTVHETEAMRALALRLGVPDEAIIMDRQGLSTEATVRNTVLMFEGLHSRRVLVVSHFYHLPRIKLAYQRHGWAVRTVPAVEARPLANMPWQIGREVAALWVYYLRPLGGASSVLPVQCASG